MILSSTILSWLPIIWAARIPAFFAPFNATVATGTPPGICKIDKTESQPSIELDDLIGTKPKKIINVLKDQNLPREHINNSIQGTIYKRYRSNLLTTSHSHKNDYAMLRQRISDSVSKSHFLLLESAANMYEEEFGLWF